MLVYIRSSMSLLRHRLQVNLQLHLPTPPQISERSSICCVPKPVPKINTTVQEADSILDFEKICVLGRGNYGIVYKVRHKKTSDIYALKIIHEECDTSVSKQPSHETKILGFINSPFVIKCHGIFEPPLMSGSKAILMEYMDAGTLDTLLKSNGRPFSEFSVVHIAFQVLKGLQYLHACNIVHLDIKPSNLLVDKNLNIKIADFGVSKMVHAHETQPNHCHSSYVGTYAYMSPERLDSSRYDPKDVYAGDVWSLGVTLLELFVGHFPFFPPEKKPSWMDLVLVTCFGDQPPCLPKGASEEFISFIKCCLEKDPSKRWTVSQLLSHPFVSTSID